MGSACCKNDDTEGTISNKAKKKQINFDLSKTVKDKSDFVVQPDQLV